MIYYPNKKEFRKIVQQGNLIPVYREICDDLETPVSAFKKIDSGQSFLLESVEGGEKIARYSFLGSDPVMVVSSHNGQVRIQEGIQTRTINVSQNPLHVVKEILARYNYVPVEGLPRFFGGMVGYMGYDLVRYFEPIPEKNPDDLKLPELLFFLVDTFLIFDHLAHTIKIISNAFIEDSAEQAYDQAVEKIDQLYQKLQAPVKFSRILNADIMDRESGNIGSAQNQVDIISNHTAAEFEGCVKKAKEYITEGDVIQVVLSQRLSSEISCSSFDLYRALRLLNPSPYMYYLKYEDMKIVGASPEILVRVVDGIAEERPIAGTRKRGSTEEEDRFLAEDLLADPKERAEHIMLLDLGRNDLGRVCRPGTVQVTEQMVIEKYSHVMHIVSNVKGILRDDLDCFDLLQACFPAGTVSGAPKVRAMQIIEELEPVRRGPYAGAVGYFGFSGNMDTCITIRTIVIKGKTAYIQAGAGIVADSDPQMEYQETLNKARALIEAIRKVQHE